MKRTLFITSILALTVTLAAMGPAAAAVGSNKFVGRVVHVSTDNIKVKDSRSGQILSFLLVPHFKQVFSADGKTTAQMSALVPGTPVTIYYDQKGLGVRHADRILINGSASSMKS